MAEAFPPNEAMLPARTLLKEGGPLAGGSGGSGGLPASPLDISERL